MKVGDIVRNMYDMRTNPAVHSPDDLIPRGTVGVVIAIRETDLNAQWNGTGEIYTDVVMSTVTGPVRCGNYISTFFEVLEEDQTYEVLPLTCNPA